MEIYDDLFLVSIIDTRFSFTEINHKCIDMHSLNYLAKILIKRNCFILTRIHNVLR